MDLAPVVARMERFPAVLEALLGGLSPGEARWRHDGQAWSIVEVVDHLVDEERLDFGVRLRSLLSDPGAPWPPIDPERAVDERRGEPRDLTAALATFAELRGDSVEWLRDLHDVDWDVSCSHPRLGRLSAGQLLASWADHDVLHLRQLAHRQHRLVERDSGYDPAYAGGW
jgi:DinB superfamily